ncbi:hypothetical protein [Brevundimonas albigilva]|uniref:Uncharacterized protein n=1 Tax=Brevundimonas albigilva TaxID=1312364 RepID=A0ABY4SH64_9CAUL|nr:hypothetical protein [Brevundimonas albigilva]URI14336.1 hypothetical protein M8231_10935 [Brevundimonas albigilva]
MTASALRDAVRRLLHTHPDVHPSTAGHAGYVERYRTAKSSNIGLETRGERHQNLFVEAASVDLGRLVDIPHEVYPAADFDRTRPNSNLFHIDAFQDVDIVRFKLSDLDQAKRVLADVLR